MAHPCRDFWHEDVALLAQRLSFVPRGSACVMAYWTYNTLVLAMRKIEGAVNVTPPGPGVPQPWLREIQDDPALAAAAASFVNYIGTDETDQTQGLPAERHTAGKPQWLQTSGVADPGAADELKDLWGRIKNALGG
jgi:hypothetical protein